MITSFTEYNEFGKKIACKNKHNLTNWWNSSGSIFSLSFTLISFSSKVLSVVLYLWSAPLGIFYLMSSKITRFCANLVFWPNSKSHFWSFICSLFYASAALPDEDQRSRESSPRRLDCFLVGFRHQMILLKRKWFAWKENDSPEKKTAFHERKMRSRLADYINLYQWFFFHSKRCLL